MLSLNSQCIHHSMKGYILCYKVYDSIQLDSANDLELKIINKEERMIYLKS